MQPIRFFNQRQVDELKAKVKENLAWYRGESAEPPLDFGEVGEMSACVDESRFAQLNANSAIKDDKQNIIAIYNALNLSPQQATEERIWVCATHTWANVYTRNRWQKIPSADDKAEKYILTHYFAAGARGLTLNNAVARLWWIGRLASSCAKYTDYSMEQKLTILLKGAMYTHLFYWHSSIASPEIFSGIIRVLGCALSTDENPAIYQRKTMRAFTKMINREGGRIMLNALSREQLDDVLNRIAEKAINNNSTN